MNTPNYPDTMSATHADTKPASERPIRRDVDWLYWIPVVLIGLGWRLFYRDRGIAVVVMFGVLVGTVAAFGLWRRRQSRNGRAETSTPAERQAATEARWAQGAAEARQREADRAAEYERAAEQRRREAAARREAEAAAGRPV